VVEAMSSHRPYRPALSIDQALEEISQKKGILYDVEVVDACVRVMLIKGFEFEENSEQVIQLIAFNDVRPASDEWGHPTNQRKMSCTTK